MIVITGPGRSGTSVLARLYRELGFDPGGRWFPEKNAGLEATEVVSLNHRIIRDLGMAPLHPPSRVPTRVRRIGRGLMPRGLRRRVRSFLYRSPWLSEREDRLADWSVFDQVVARHRDTIHQVAARLPVVKDPRFCWSLPVWTAAGAPIEHVLITLRNVDAMVESHLAAGHLAKLSPGAARNSFLYATGLCLTTVLDHGLSHAVLRFPDFLSHPNELMHAMRFPQPVGPHRFAAALAAVRDDHLVHDWR